MGRPSPSLILVGNGGAIATGSGACKGGVEVAVDATPGVDPFFLDDEGCGCEGVWGAASEARLFAADSRRSRAGSLRFSAIAGFKKCTTLEIRRLKACRCGVDATVVVVLAWLDRGGGKEERKRRSRR